MSWLTVILMAVISAIITAVFLQVPIFKDTSFERMGVIAVIMASKVSFSGESLLPEGTFIRIMPRSRSRTAVLLTFLCQTPLRE